MKKFVSLLIILSLLVSMLSPLTAYAATTPATKKTIDERIADIYKTYGVGVTYIDDFSFAGYKITKEDIAVLDKVITNIEKALAIVGSGFTKAISKRVEDTRNSNIASGVPYNISLFVDGSRIVGLAICIEAAVGRPLGYDSNQVHWYDDAMFISSCGYGSYDPAPVGLILSQIAGMFEYYVVKSNNAARGAFKSQTYPMQKRDAQLKIGYNPTNGVNDWLTDYGFVFCHLVMNNDQNKLTPNTTAWKKGETVYNDLVKYLGTGSRATQRAGANLGIKVPKAK